ncbi:MAG: hypothetical protein ACI9YO_001343 [Gammaproteobacteria bacterium]|jgi:uncharacterized protein YjiS (DUF1127 family)
MKYRDTIKQYSQRIQQLMIRRRTRQQLLQLDETSLHDVGITRSQAIEEGSKPFWKSSVQTIKVIQEWPVESIGLVLDEVR